MKKTKLNIVILNYNTREFLRKCLLSLKKVEREVNFKVIIADNGSGDGSLKMINKEFPWIDKVVKNRKNIGFAAGNNVVLKKFKSEYVLLLNPDTIVYPNTISKVLKYMMNNKDVGAATCKVELPDGKLDYSCHRGFPTPWNSFCYFSGLSKLFPKSKYFSGYTATFQNFNTIHEIDALTGAFAFIRKIAGDEVGWFDEDYFWNGEDIDLCYKLKEKNWKVIYIPDVKITHFKGSASGLRKNKQNKPERKIKKQSALSSTQVMKIFYDKHLAKKYPFVVNTLVYMGIKVLEVFRVTKQSI